MADRGSQDDAFEAGRGRRIAAAASGLLLALLLSCALAVPACFYALAAPAHASGGDQDRARLALERGEIRPLDEVLKAVREAAPGDVVSLDLKRDDGRWIYKLKVLASTGKRRSVEIDAKSLRVLDDDDDD